MFLFVVEAFWLGRRRDWSCCAKAGCYLLVAPSFLYDTEDVLPNLANTSGKGVEVVIHQYGT